MQLSEDDHDSEASASTPHGHDERPESASGNEDGPRHEASIRSWPRGSVAHPPAQRWSEEDAWNNEPASTILTGEENFQEARNYDDDSWNVEPVFENPVPEETFEETSKSDPGTDEEVETQSPSVDPWSTLSEIYPIDEKNEALLSADGDGLGNSINPPATTHGENELEKASKVSLPASNSDSDSGIVGSLPHDARSPSLNEDELIDSTNDRSPGFSANGENGTRSSDSWSRFSIKNVVKEISKLPFFSADDENVTQPKSVGPPSMNQSEDELGQKPSKLFLSIDANKGKLPAKAETPASISEGLARLVIDDNLSVDSKHAYPDMGEQNKKDFGLPLPEPSNNLPDDPEDRLACRALISKKLADIAQHYSYLEDEHPDPRQDLDYWNVVVEDLRKRTSRAYRCQRSPNKSSSYSLDSFSHNLLQAAGLKMLIDDEDGSEEKLVGRTCKW